MKYLVMLILMMSATLSGISQQAEFEWAVQCGNPPNTTDVKTSLAAAEDGSFYLAGEFTDTAFFGNKNIISAGGTDVFLVKHNSQGSPVWETRLGAADYDYIQKVAVTPAGDVILAGYFYGTTLLGTDEYTAYGSQDIFIAAFDGEGNFLWSERAGGGMADYISSIDVDADNNIIISGYFYGEIDFGDTLLTAAASSDIFIARYSPEGELLWALAAGGSSSDQARSVSCDPEGNIYLAASFYYDFTFGDTTLSTSNPVGVAVVKLNPEGLFQMAFQLNGTYLTPDVFLKADHVGNFYLSGNFSEEIFLGDSVFTAGPFNQDVFVARFGNDGEFLWASHGYSYSSDQAIGLDIDQSDNLYLSGHYLDHIHFEQLTLNYTLCCGSREIFIVNYSNDGKVNWGKQISGARASVQAVTMEESGDFLLSGMFTDTLSFDNLNLVNYGSYRNYVTCLKTDAATAIGNQVLPAGLLRIIPNPAHDRIEILSMDGNDPVAIDIYGLTGDLVYSNRNLTGNSIDVSRFSPGIYFLRAMDSSLRVFTGRFMKL
jgi:hypothetical protein